MTEFVEYVIKLIQIVIAFFIDVLGPAGAQLVLLAGFGITLFVIVRILIHRAFL